MKRLWENLKIGLIGLLVFITFFVICCLGGIFTISIVSVFTCDRTAVLTAGAVGYFVTIPVLTILASKWLEKPKQKNSQKDTRE